MSEVFVVDRAALFDGAWPAGFAAMPGAQGLVWLDRALAAGRFEPRETAERTAAWKQLIPYCVLRTARSTSGDQAGVLCVRRSRGQSEARLHGLWSIGLGGHVEPTDAPPDSRGLAGDAFFAAALARELGEELHVPPQLGGTPKFVGVLNDDSSAVGEVHAGLVYVWDLPGPCSELAKQVSVAEISKMTGGFTSLVEFRKLWQDPLQFETWSRFLVRAGIAGPMGDSSQEGVAQDTVSA